MKYKFETEEEFSRRVELEKSRGVCVFRDDQNREDILDLIYNYVDICDAVSDHENLSLMKRTNFKS